MSFVGNAISSVGNVVGGLLGGGKQSAPPPAPDYTGAAQATAQYNKEAAREAAAANRINQVTPYGNLTYTQAGEDAYGNPMWTATQTLSPAQQQILDLSNKLSIGTGELGGTALKYVGQQLDKPFDLNQLPSLGINPSETYTDAYLRRLAPSMQQGRDRLEQQLANQGIQIGSEAYDRAIRNFEQKQNDLMLGATTQGFDVGQRARAARFGELAYQRNEPLNVLSALRSGSQVTPPSFINAPMQATTAGPDLLSAAQAQGQYNLGGYNANLANQSAMTGGLFNLAGAALMSPTGTFTGPTGLFSKAGSLFSDIRLKENIKPVGVMPNGLTLYSFEYVDEIKSHPLAGDGVHVGVMAQEVEQVFPYAVTTLDDGYKVVNYGLLP